MSGTVKSFLDSRIATDLDVTPSSELDDREIQQRRLLRAGSTLSSPSVLKGALVLLSIVAVSVLTYLPAIDNSFISDDFTLFSLLKVLDQYPLYIFEAASELFRVVTYVYFWTCFKVLGLVPELYYWSSIALHAIVSLLVYLLVRVVTKQPVAALGAAVFFAAYERHQEAVMWISAANEIILTLNCVLFLILWESAISRARFRRTNFTLALIVFGLALFSKEAAVALVPLVMIGMMLRGYYFIDVFRRCWPLLVMVGMYVTFWLSQANRNFFVTDGHYALGLQFIPVYVHTLTRLLSQVLPFFVAFLVVRSRRVQDRLKTDAFTRTLHAKLLSDPSLLFFAALLVLSIVPYSFLTYLDHIPSRNTYFPSVGLAGINGILLAAVYGGLPSVRFKRLSVLFLSVIVAANIAYIWLKKDPQYVERAEPTRKLIEILNSPDIAWNNHPPIYVCGFLLHPWIGSEAVAGFTRFNSKEVVFSETCDGVGDSTVLRWDQGNRTYMKFP